MADSLQPTYLIEAALLTSPQPLKLESLVKLLDGSLKKAQVLELLAKLEVFWRSRGLRLVETAEGWRFQSTAEVTQALVMLDSHSYTDGDSMGILWKYDNIHQDQIDWYAKEMDEINEYNKTIYANAEPVKNLAFFHIPLPEYRDAWGEYVENDNKDTENVTFVYGVMGESMKENSSGKAIFAHEVKNGYFALQVDDTVSYGRLPIGTYLLVAGMELAQNSDMVVAKIRETAQIVVCTYTREGSRITLTPFDSGKQSISWDFKEKPGFLFWMYPVIEANLNFRRNSGADCGENPSNAEEKE